MNTREQKHVVTNSNFPRLPLQYVELTFGKWAVQIQRERERISTQYKKKSLVSHYRKIRDEEIK